MPTSTAEFLRDGSCSKGARVAGECEALDIEEVRDLVASGVVRDVLAGTPGHPDANAPDVANLQPQVNAPVIDSPEITNPDESENLVKVLGELGDADPVSMGVKPAEEEE